MQEVETREVNLAHPDTLTEVLRASAADPDTGQALIDQLATDMSGRYQDYVIAFDGNFDSQALGIALDGQVWRDTEWLGYLSITAVQDEQDRPVVSLGLMGTDGGRMWHRAQLYPVLETALRPYFERSGIDRIRGPFLDTADTANTEAGLPAGEPEQGSREDYRRQDIDTRQAELQHASTLTEALLHHHTNPHGLFTNQLADD